MAQIPLQQPCAVMEIVEIPSGPDGRIDLQALRAAVDDETAAMMITNPSTLGVFEPEIAEAARIVHEAGGQMYYDGANFNAILGKTDPGRMWASTCPLQSSQDVQPTARRRRPRSGPIGVKSHLAKYLPSPIAAEGSAQKTTPKAWATASGTLGKTRNPR